MLSVSKRPIDNVDVLLPLNITEEIFGKSKIY